MMIKISLALNVEMPGGGWVKNLIDLTPVVKKYYATRTAIERAADRLRGVANAALGFDRCVWGMG